jgi:predicted transcriptional regulator
MRIIRLLLKRQSGVGEISQRLGLSEYNVSKHLRVLKEAGLLQMQKQGKRHLYSVPPGLKAQIKANAKVLDLGCCTFHF